MADCIACSSCLLSQSENLDRSVKNTNPILTRFLRKSKCFHDKKHGAAVMPPRAHITECTVKPLPLGMGSVNTKSPHCPESGPSV